MGRFLTWSKCERGRCPPRLALPMPPSRLFEACSALPALHAVAMCGLPSPLLPRAPCASYYPSRLVCAACICCLLPDCVLQALLWLWQAGEHMQAADVLIPCMVRSSPGADEGHSSARSAIQRQRQSEALGPV